nr:PREDICTED: uncharacterized protein LOC108205609 isoform X2 [Daucus carota subsp. sativus]
MEMDETQARSLVDKISDEIENGDIKHCSEHGWFKEEKQRLIAIKDSLKEEKQRLIAIKDSLKEEKQRLIAIKDSLKDVDNMLVLLQRLQSRQRQQCQEAFIKLENSRMHLMANIKHFQQHELDVIGELNALKVEGGSCWPLFINCVRGLFNPWNWRTTAIKIALISVSVSSTYKLCQSGQDDKCVSSLDSVIPRNFNLLANGPLDVSYGKG